LLMMFWMWLRKVLMLMSSRPLISWLLKPSARKRRTAVSRWVRASPE
jgi:hypothetical protein